MWFVHMVYIRNLCTRIIHVVYARGLCTRIMYMIYARGLCTRIMYVVYARGLCTPISKSEKYAFKRLAEIDSRTAQLGSCL